LIITGIIVAVAMSSPLWTRPNSDNSVKVGTKVAVMLRRSQGTSQGVEWYSQGLRLQGQRQSKGLGVEGQGLTSLKNRIL